MRDPGGEAGDAPIRARPLNPHRRILLSLAFALYLSGGAEGHDPKPIGDGYFGGRWG